jgi:hypothetical protein
VHGSDDGDTIEIRGDGPFTSDQIFGSKALTIRAAAGFAPVIRVNPGNVVPQLLSQSGRPLVLEGLEIDRLRAMNEPASAAGIIACYKGRVHVANCRFVFNQRTLGTVLDVYQCPVLEVRNCQFLNGPRTGAIQWLGSQQSRIRLKNNVLAGDYDTNPLQSSLRFSRQNPDDRDVAIHLVSNTFLARPLVTGLLGPGQQHPASNDPNPAGPPIHIESFRQCLRSAGWTDRSLRRPGRPLRGGVLNTAIVRVYR